MDWVDFGGYGTWTKKSSWCGSFISLLLHSGHVRHDDGIRAVGWRRTYCRLGSQMRNVVESCCCFHMHEASCERCSSTPARLSRTLTRHARVPNHLDGQGRDSLRRIDAMMGQKIFLREEVDLEDEVRSVGLFVAPVVAPRCHWGKTVDGSVLTTLRDSAS